MNANEVEKYRRRAIYVARKHGYPELADDFAGQIFVYFLEKPNRGATVDQLFIDFLRSTYGRPGTPGGDARISGILGAVSLDQVIGGDESESGPLLSEFIRCPSDDSEPEHRDGDFDYCFRGCEAEIYQLYFIDHRSGKDIGHSLGVTESRVSQIISGMKRKIQDSAILQEARSRMEWDNSFLCFQVEWLSL